MISVLIVEDEEIAAEANRRYVLRVPGFQVAGSARTGADALRILRHEHPDLILLDLNLPDMHGLDLARSLRAAGNLCDIMAITSARDLTMVRSAVSLGVTQYLLKPFTFDALRQKLQQYKQFRESTAGAATGQGEVDRALNALRAATRSPLPKGLTQATLEAIAGELGRHPEGVSAQAVGTLIGVSRVTARRYLEHLAETGLARRVPRYGEVGRPELVYQPEHL
ncbi:response regulator [Streptosporangiaceae bacterium NEAU-GS5]|nr:response regulator [Streptosporangiaceae bacterium NEAU-GS5]